MRVLLVSSHGADLAYGGAERYVAELATGLRDRGHEPVVLSAFPPQAGPVGIETSTLHRTDWRTDPSRRIRNHLRDALSLSDGRLERAVKAAAADVVHTSNLPGFSTAVWDSTRRVGVPLVHTLHDYHLLCPRTTLLRRDALECSPHPLLCGLRSRRLARFAHVVSHVIAGSGHLLRRHEGFFPTPHQKVIRLPLAPVATRPLAAPVEPPQTVGYLGALNTAKGVTLLVDAASALQRAGVELHVAGDGPLRGVVEAAAAAGKLRYAGAVHGADKIAFLESCDLAVVPSLWEEPSGPPYVVLEWLAAGRPVVATERGGLAEARELRGVTTFEPSAGRLVDAVQTLRNGSGPGGETSALAQVHDRNDVDRWLDEHEDVYRAARGSRVRTDAAA
jgi:glycosyltransferase involved in cell wall biosynthesis